MKNSRQSKEVVPLSTQIHEWTFELISESPLHIGGEDEEIIVDQKERPIIPGTSLAGACRSYMESSQFADLTETLFGSQDSRQPHVGLIFFDSTCLGNYYYEIRPRVSIDGKTKTAERGQFFERTFLAPGTTFTTKLVLKISKDKNDEYLEAVEHMLYALHFGLIRIGAHQSIGGGQMRISDCQYVHYDCSDVEQLKAYVDQTKQREPYEFTEDMRLQSIVKFTIHAETDTPLLIGKQNVHHSDKPDVTYMTTKRNGEDQPFIPGSSFKGVLRHRIERITNVLSLKNKTSYVEHLFGSGKHSEEKRTSALRFEDIIIEQPKAKTYYRTSINPLTGSVRLGAFLDEETVTGQFTANIYFKVNEENENFHISIGLLLFALRDLALQQFSLGSRAGIGYGYVNVKSIEMVKDDKRVFIDVENERIEDPQNWLQTIDQQLQREKEVIHP